MLFLMTKMRVHTYTVGSNSKPSVLVQGMSISVRCKHQCASLSCVVCLSLWESLKYHLSVAERIIFFDLAVLFSNASRPLVYCGRKLALFSNYILQ